MALIRSAKLKLYFVRARRAIAHAALSTVRARIYYLRVPGSQVEIPLLRLLKEKHTMRVIVRFLPIAAALG
jgi:carbohydrate-binding DOMON domain-containing protein